MHRWQGKLFAALILAVGSSTAAHSTDIYKCTADGTTVYTDQPCSAGKPDMGRLANPSGEQSETENNPAALMRDVHRLSEHERQLRAQQQSELEQLRIRMAGVRDDAVVQREVAAFKDRWQRRFAESNRQRQAVIDRLKRLCPGGASLRAERATCHQRGE